MATVVEQRHFNMVPEFSGEPKELANFINISEALINKFYNRNEPNDFENFILLTNIKTKIKGESKKRSHTITMTSVALSKSPVSGTPYTYLIYKREDYDSQLKESKDMLVSLTPNQETYNTMEDNPEGSVTLVLFATLNEEIPTLPRITQGQVGTCGLRLDVNGKELPNENKVVLSNHEWNKLQVKVRNTKLAYPKIKFNDYVLKHLNIGAVVLGVDQRLLTILNTRIEDQRCPQIGLRTQDCVMLANEFSLRRGNHFLLGDKIKRHKLNNMLGYYFNTYLAIWPPELYQKTLQTRLDLENQGVIRLYSYEDSEIEQVVEELSLNQKQYIQTAFMAVASVCKKASATNDPNPPNSEFVGKWLNSRIDSLMVKCGYPAEKTDMIKWVRDIILIAKYLDDVLPMRQYITMPIAKTECDSYSTEINFWVPLVDYCRLIMSFAGLSTIETAYNFGRTPVTAAHSLEGVVSQTKELITKFKELSSDDIVRQRGYKLEYLYLQQVVPKELEVATYPDLCYCALYAKKIESLNSSWDNFQATIQNITISADELRKRTSIPLLSSSGGALPEDVANFLEQHGKRYEAPTNIQPPRIVTGLSSTK